MKCSNMKVIRNILCLLLIGFLFGCSGDITKSGSNNTSTVIGSETSADGKIKLQKLEGGDIPISIAPADQQNPHVIYLPDKNLWFSVYEDWSSATTGADIKGRFIKSDGILCGSELTITNVSGNQTVPWATYRDREALQAPYTGTGNDTIMVVWQDTRGTANSGYVYHKAINVSSLNTTDCSGYTLGGENAVSYNQILKYDSATSISTITNELTKTIVGDWLLITISGTLANIPVVPGSVFIEVPGTNENANDDGIGKLVGGASGTINYSTGSFSIGLQNVTDGQEVRANYSYYTSFPPSTSSVGDNLLSRKSPKIAYDPVKDSFWVVWNESRNILNRVSELCFGFVPVAWEFGDTSFPGYVILDGSTFAELSSKIGVSGADIIRNGINETRTNRLITNSSAPLAETYTYEFFTNANNITAASDTTSPEDFIVWEGNRQKGVLECKCTDNNSNLFCDLGDSVTSTFTTSNYDDGLVHIYGLFDKEISQGSLFSKKLDTSSSNTYYPSVGFDPITKRFLVAWEDLRDGSNTKIYGQLVYSGGGLYNENTLISYQDTDGGGTQDTNIVNSKQTKPFISYDSVNQRYFVIWQDGRNGSVSLENLDIYGQYVDAEGSLRGSNYSISTAQANQYNPTIAYNSQNNQFLAVWKDARNYTTTASDIYGQRFSLGMPQLTLLNANDTSFSPPLINFGTVNTGYSAASSFKVKNTGDANLKIDCLTPPTMPLNATSNPFAHVALTSELQTCDCVDGNGNPDYTVTGCKYLELVPSSEQSFSITFSTTTEGTFISSFDIKSDAENKTINLQGTGALLDMTISPSPLDFGNTTTFSTVSKTLTIENKGTVSYQITAITGDINASWDGFYSDLYSIDFPYTLDPGKSLTLTIEFEPWEVKGYSGTMYIQTSVSGFSKTVTVTGTGTGTPALSTSDAQIDFGSVDVGATSDQTLTITNSGDATLTISDISLTGSAFSFPTQPNLPIKIAPEGSQSIKVTFSPASAAYYNETLSIKSDGGNVDIGLVGQGAIVSAPDISISPSPINFPDTKVGLTQSMNLAIKNNGSLAVKINSFDLPASPFSITTPATPYTLNAGDTLNLVIKFSPTTAGSFSSSLGILPDFSTTSTIVNITGTGSSTTQAGNIVFQQNASQVTSVAFGNVFKGSSSKKTLSVKNNGSNAATINSVSISNAAFTATLPSPFTLNAGGTKTFDMTFTPASVTPYSATLTLPDASGSSYQLSLTGAGSSVDVKSSAGTVSYFTALTSSQLPTSAKPGDFTISKAAEFVIEGITPNSTVTVTLTFDSLPSNPVFYKVVGDTWLLLTGYTLSGNTLTYAITDNGPFDSDSTTGIIRDPVVVGSTGAGGGGGSISSSGGGCSIGGHQNAPTAIADFAVMLMPLFAIIMLRIRRKKK